LWSLSNVSWLHTCKSTEINKTTHKKRFSDIFTLNNKHVWKTNGKYDRHYCHLQSCASRTDSRSSYVNEKCCCFNRWCASLLSAGML
jgi:hypothetical protein